MQMLSLKSIARYSKYGLWTAMVVLFQESWLGMRFQAFRLLRRERPASREVLARGDRFGNEDLQSMSIRNRARHRPFCGARAACDAVTCQWSNIDKSQQAPSCPCRVYPSSAVSLCPFLCTCCVTRNREPCTFALPRRPILLLLVETMLHKTPALIHFIRQSHWCAE